MNSNQKTLNLYIRDEKTLPLYVDGFTETDSLIFRISGSTEVTFSPKLISKQRMSILGETIFTVTAGCAIQQSNLISASSLSGDCFGVKEIASFSGSLVYLKFGVDSLGKNKTWMSFPLQFGITKGFHIESATMKLIPYQTVDRVEGQPCSIKAGFDPVYTAIPPTNWSELNAKSMTTNYYSNSDVATWNEGEEVTMDVTKSLKDILGYDAVTWDDSGYVDLGFIIKDYGSYTNSYRTVTSYEGAVANPDYAAPTIDIAWGYNYYTDEILDTYISKSSPSSVKYSSKKLIVGERTEQTSAVNRILLKPDVGSILPTATVTSACVCLYQESSFASNSRTMRAYRMLSDWDLYSSSWSRRCGTVPWTAGGSTVTDCEVSSSGSLLLSATASNGWKYLVLSSGSVQAWIDGSLDNYGLMLRMETENNDAHIFTSSNGDTASNHPKFIIEYDDGSPKRLVLQV